jgi:surface antigen
VKDDGRKLRWLAAATGSGANEKRIESMKPSLAVIAALAASLAGCAGFGSGGEVTPTKPGVAAAAPMQPPQPMAPVAAVQAQPLPPAGFVSAPSAQQTLPNPPVAAASAQQSPPAQALPSGAALGGVLGGPVGASLTDADRAAAWNAEVAALDSGQRRSWKGSNGVFGFVAPGAEAGPGCRAYSQTIYIAGRPNRGRGVACKQADGTWKAAS